MKPKRIFRVYQEAGRPAGVVEVTSISSVTRKYATTSATPGPWRWRLIAARNGQIVGGSQEAFDSKANALRAARREASLLKDGFAAVEVAG